MTDARATMVDEQGTAHAFWLRAPGGVAAGLGHAWAALRQDWLVLLVLSDACVFSLCALVWLWRDLARERTGRSARTLWFAAALLLGSPVLLVYLARRATGRAPVER